MNKDLIIAKQGEIIDFLILCIEEGFDYGVDTVKLNKLESELASLQEQGEERELFQKININSENDLPKAGLYFCAVTDNCFGSFHFNPDDKDDIDFWIGNIMWYLKSNK